MKNSVTWILTGLLVLAGCGAQPTDTPLDEEESLLSGSIESYWVSWYSTPDDTAVTHFSERQNRNRLLDSWARQRGSYRCNVWSSMDASQKGVFLTTTNLLQYSWMRPNRYFYTSAGDQCSPGGECTDGCMVLQTDYRHGADIESCNFVSGETCHSLGKCSRSPMPRVGKGSEGMLDHVSKIYWVYGGPSCGGSGNRIFFQADRELMYRMRNLSYAPLPWRNSGDLAGPHSPFTQSRETNPGKPRGQSHQFAWDYQATSIPRAELAGIVDPKMIELDLDYNWIHHSNPECYYEGEYGRDRYTRLWSQQGFPVDLSYVPFCLGDNRFFVRQQYLDFLVREPDEGGLAYWSGVLDQCNYDDGCLGGQRRQVARAFMESIEFKNAHPALHQPVGSAAYNEEYVRQCYFVFLRRAPDPAGFNFWLGVINSTGDFAALIGAFLESQEYLARFPASGVR